jgi:hypothetical protein
MAVRHWLDDRRLILLLTSCSSWPASIVLDLTDAIAGSGYILLTPQRLPSSFVPFADSLPFATPGVTE